MVKEVHLAELGTGAREILSRVAHVLGGQEVYLVGGTVRDLLLGRGSALHDLDLAVPREALSLARRLADHLGGHFVIMKEEHGTARVLMDDAGERYQLDLADFRGHGIEADLRGRDFSVNALALQLSALLREGVAPLIDPLGGAADLENRQLRLCSPQALLDDPVRALRAARLAVAYELTIPAELVTSLAITGPLLSQVSVERIRDELLRLLDLPRGSRGLRELDRQGLLEALLPEVGPMRRCPQGPPHRWDVLDHSLRAVEAVEVIFAELDGLFPDDPDLRTRRADSPEPGIGRAALLKLAALLHDVAKPATRTVDEERVRFIGHDKLGAEITRAIGHRLRLANASVQFLERLVRHHLRPMHLSQLETITSRARYRFYRDLGDTTPDLILLVAADAAATVGMSPGEVMGGATGRLLRDLLEGWRAAREEARVPPLVNGNDVMAAFGLPPGPLVGHLLAQAREAQALGLVRTKAEAIDTLRRRLDETGGIDTAPGGSLE